MKLSRINLQEMRVAFIPGTRNVRLLEDFTVEIKIGDTIHRKIIPAGFVSDGASIPRWAWAIVSPYDPGVREAALIHDYFYRESKARLISGDCIIGIEVTRAMADKIFYEELLDGDVPNWKAHSMYLAVRGAGGGPPKIVEPIFQYLPVVKNWKTSWVEG